MSPGLTQTRADAERLRLQSESLRRIPPARPGGSESSQAARGPAVGGRAEFEGVITVRPPARARRVDPCRPGPGPPAARRAAVAACHTAAGPAVSCCPWASESDGRTESEVAAQHWQPAGPRAGPSETRTGR
jgi:hypothetical protein